MESQAKTQAVFQAKTKAKMFLLNWPPEVDQLSRRAASRHPRRRRHSHPPRPRLELRGRRRRRRFHDLTTLTNNAKMQIYSMERRRLGCVNLSSRPEGFTQPSLRLFPHVSRYISYFPNFLGNKTTGPLSSRTPQKKFQIAVNIATV